MKIKSITFDVEYKEFEIGEKVKPSSTRCSLFEGVYVVTKFIAPKNPGDDSTIFVEGRKTGISTEYVVPAE